MEILVTIKLWKKINIHMCVYILYIIHKYKYIYTQNRKIHMNKDVKCSELVMQLLQGEKTELLFNKTDTVDFCP